MSIFSAQKYCAALWDWDFLIPCFSRTGIKIADIDGILDDDRIVEKQGYVERFCHHLLFETTVPLDRKIKTGQLRGHAALVMVGFSVIYLWGNPNHFPIYKVQIWPEFSKQPFDPVLNVDESSLVGWVSRWFQLASQNPITPPHSSLFFNNQTKACA